MCLGFFVITWVEKVNKFAEPGVRIHAEQRVIDTGPYAIVRHPMYLGAIPYFVGTALALGSYWALIPAAIAILILVPRTMMEDKSLHEELEGYKEYAARVRCRLIPPHLVDIGPGVTSGHAMGRAKFQVQVSRFAAE